MSLVPSPCVQISLEELMQRAKVRTASGRRANRRAAKTQLRKLDTALGEMSELLRAQRKSATELAGDERSDALAEITKLEKTLDAFNAHRETARRKLRALAKRGNLYYQRQTLKSLLFIDPRAGTESRISYERSGGKQGWIRAPILTWRDVMWRLLQLCCSPCICSVRYMTLWCHCFCVLFFSRPPPKRTRHELRLMRRMLVEQRRRDANVKQWVGHVKTAITQLNLLLPKVQKQLINSTGYKLDLRSAVGLVKTDLKEMCAVHKGSSGALTDGLMGVGKAALTEAMKQVRPKLRLETDFTRLKEGRSPIIEFSIDFVLAGAEDDEDGDDYDLEGFNDMAGAKTMARKMLLIKLKQLLEPLATKYGVPVDDVVAALETASFDELQQALTHPDALFGEAQSGPMAKRMLIASCRSQLEPALEKANLTFEQMLPVLDSIDSFEEVQAVLADFDAFLATVAKASSPLAKKLLLVQARGVMEPKVQSLGLEWNDVLPLLESIESLEELTDVNACLARVAQTSTSPAAAKVVKMMAIAAVRPQLEAKLAPHLEKEGLEWHDVLPLLEGIDTVAEVEAAISQLMMDGAGPIAHKMAIAAGLRRKLEPLLEEQGLQWSDVRSMLDEQQLTEADLYSCVEKFARSVGATAKASSKGASAFSQLDPTTLPPHFQKLHELFFNTSSELNLVHILKELAADFLRVVQHAVTVVYQASCAKTQTILFLLPMLFTARR